MPLIVLVGGLIGGSPAATCCQYWIAGLRLPDEHRRPAVSTAGRRSSCRPSSAPSCSPSLAAVIGMFAVQRPAAALPPGVQRAGASRRASRDRFFLVIEAGDPQVRPRRRPRASSPASTRARCPTLSLTDLASARRCARVPGFGRRLPAAWRPWPAAATTCRTRTRCGPTRESTFFADGPRRGRSRPTPWRAATCAPTRPFYTGVGADNSRWPTCPFPVTREVLLRGQERFNIFCSPCHGRLGRFDLGRRQSQPLELVGACLAHRVVVKRLEGGEQPVADCRGRRGRELLRTRMRAQTGKARLAPAQTEGAGFLGDRLQARIFERYQLCQRGFQIGLGMKEVGHLFRPSSPAKAGDPALRLNDR